MSKHRKSAGRRRSRSLVGFASKDLCEMIPKALPPAERLLMLFEKVFQYSLSTVQKDMMLSEDLDISSFKADSNTCWDKIKAAIVEQNICVAAFEGKTLNLSDPNITCLEDKKAILEVECQKWSEQISLAREAMSNEINKSYTVNVSEYPDRDMLYNYSDVIEETSSTYEKIQFKLDNVKIATKPIKQHLNMRNNSRILEECERYFETKSNVSTPKSLIVAVNNARKMSNHCNYS